MHNPSYLVKSRHNIFYFRYPLSIKPLQGNRSPRISVSLKTRCPKEALRRSKALEYHTSSLMTEMDLERMDYAEIKSMVEASFAKELARQKGMIDRSDPIPDAVKKRLLSTTEGIDRRLERKEPDNDWFPDDSEIADIVKEYALDLSNSEEDRQKLKILHLKGTRALMLQLLTYSDIHNEFDFSGAKRPLAEPESISPLTQGI